LDNDRGPDLGLSRRGGAALKRFRVLAVVIVATLGLLLCCAPRAGAGGDTAFETVDANKDKKIDLKEFLDAADKTFEASDTDKDGSMDQKELQSQQPSVRDWLEGLMKLDLNRNGKLDRKEFLDGATARFHELDTNKDGALDPDEFNPKRGPGVHPFIILRF